METDLIRQYFYLWSAALAVPPWAFIFYKKKTSRVEMIYMGIFCGAAALALDRYTHFHDYWQPPIIYEAFNFESLLCGFLFGGIAAKSYETFFSKDYSTRKIPNPLFLLAFATVSVVLYMLLLGLFQLNSVDIVVCVFVAWIMLFLFINPELFKMCIGSGIIMTGFCLYLYTIVLAIYPSAIQDIWLMKNLKGIYIFDIPIEEYYFFFSFGCIVSILYKVATTNISKFSHLLLPEPLKNPNPELHQPNRRIFSRKSSSMPDLLEPIRPFQIPLLLLLIVIGRILIFGDARIPVGQFSNLF